MNSRKRSLIFATVSLLLAGGAGLQAAGENPAPQPYVFKFNGDVPGMKAELKRMLIEKGFSIADDDPQAGVLSTQYKHLEESEQSDDAGANGILRFFGGARLEYGSAAFLFSTDSGTAQCKMISYLSRNAARQAGPASSGDGSKDYILAPQQSLFARNLASAVAALPNFTAVTPIPSEPASQPRPKVSHRYVEHGHVVDADK